MSIVKHAKKKVSVGPSRWRAVSQNRCNGHPIRVVVLSSLFLLPMICVYCANHHPNLENVNLHLFDVVLLPFSRSYATTLNDG
jgi:hypothetical protein